MRPLVPLILLTCLSACSDKDAVELSTMRESDSATLMLNGRRERCEPYQVTHGSPKAWFSNFRTSGDCSSEVAVFATGYKMALKDTSGTWTDAPGDVASVPMVSDPYDVPLNVFILAGDLVNHDAAVRQTEAVAGVISANEMWDQSQCGVRFSIMFIDDARTKTPFELLKADCTDNGKIAEFKAIDQATTKLARINVFYNDRYDEGQTCSDGNTALILIGQLGGPAELAHELGHALSLDHTNAVGGMPADDLMASPSPNPASLTVGQCFRANVNVNSVLNTLPVRSGPTRTCPDSTTNGTCPPLTIHR